jgi:2-amino-4-hydroxy-6-hydroxymethyldihydropteridine diphosphokinase
MNLIYLALGTNLGNKQAYLLRAIGCIAEKIGIFSAISSVYETKPWGFESDNDFLNMVVCVETLLTPGEILTITQTIEKTMGRVHKTNHSYHDRVIDIDLIAYDNLIIRSKNLQLPHPLFHKRRFVLEPFNEIVPNFVHPVFHKPVKELLRELNDA